MQELTLSISDPSSVVDYGRGPGDYRDFQRHIDDVVSRGAEDELVKSVGLGRVLEFAVRDWHGFDSLLKIAARQIKRETIYIVLLRSEGFGGEEGTPYVQVSIANEFQNKIGALVKQSLESRISKKVATFKVFDVRMKIFDGKVDLSELKFE